MTPEFLVIRKEKGLQGYRTKDGLWSYEIKRAEIFNRYEDAVKIINSIRDLYSGIDIIPNPFPFSISLLKSYEYH
jgi:hypothetical protein